MKKTSKVFAVILAVTMLTAIFVGCGGNKKESTSTTIQGTNAGTETLQEPVGEPTEIRIMTFDNYSADFPLTNNLSVWDYIQEITNVKIKWEVAANGEAYQTLVTPRMAAAVDLPDVVCTGPFDDASVQKFGEQGIIYVLDDYIDKYAPNIKKFYSSQPLIDKATRGTDGKRYYISVCSENLGACLYALFLRQDWLDSLGLKVPTTVDEVYEVCVAMRERDANNNGNKDEILSIFPNFKDYPYGTLCGSFGLVETMDWYADENGKVQYAWAVPEAKAYIEFWAKMYKAECLDKDSVSGNSYDSWIQKIAENKAMGVTNLNHMYNWFNSQVKTDPNAKYIGLIDVKGPEGVTPIIWRNPPSANPGYKFSVTKAVGNDRIGAVMAFLDWFYSEEGINTYNYGIPGVHYNIVNGKPTFTDEAKKFIAEKSLSQLMIENGFGWNYMPAVCFLTVEEFGTNEGWPQEEIERISAYVKKSIPLPLFAAATEEELKAIEDIGGDWVTYLQESLADFLTGKKSLDKWDEYVRRLNELGLAKMQAIKQAQYDRINK